jgi:hypothetical protein
MTTTTNLPMPHLTGGAIPNGRPRTQEESAMSETITKHDVTDPRTLISPSLRGLIAGDVMARLPQMTVGLADTGVGQMAAFLAACAASDRPLSPSPLIDDFWHAFVLRTAAYAEFCDQQFGKFVHHQPGFLDKEEHGGGKVLRARTVNAIVTLGYLVDYDFWPELDLADCSQCYANCHDSPFRGRRPASS